MPVLIQRHCRARCFSVRFAPCLLAVCVLLAGASASFQVKAQSEASALSALSALPVASVLVAGGVMAGGSGSEHMPLPLALSVGGAVLVVKTVESTARGTVYVLERVSDGASASIEVVGKGLGGLSTGVGASVQVSAIGAGVVLSAAGEAIAFIPNALGRALLHNERLTD